MTQASTQEKNYKDTLNLPRTSFPMKANAAQREPEIEAYWESKQVYEKAQAAKDKTRKFVLHDGPPYLSSDKIHIGTALNKILKDIVTRYKHQRGFYAPYVPGYDGHGLPIENAVVKSIEGGRAAISPFELRQKCRDFGLKNLAGQEANFKRLGVWGDWAHPYITIDGAFEARQIELFWEMYKKGYVYKGKKPVYWCCSCETALADAEVEYADHTSPSVYVKFPFVRGGAGFTTFEWTGQEFDLEKKLADASFVIWTTTPWTLPANKALSVHPDFQYSIIQTPTHGKLIVATDLLEAFLQATGLDKNYEVLYPGHIIKGIHLRYSEVNHPFLEREVPVLCGTHVTADAGTGIVHTAPGHGMEDYVVVQKYNQEPEFKSTPIEIVSPIDNKGHYTEEAGDPRLTGAFYKKGNKLVLEMLQENNALLHHSDITHSYPHCWRCHNPVIYRATEQWFIGVDKFRKQALDAIETVTWLPEQGKNRITSMVANRSDWCISRQRVWGVPIPAFYCEGCDHKLVMSDETVKRVADIFREKTSDAWWQMSAAELLAGVDIQCDGCGPESFRKEMDIMDVWFDSGVTHTTVVEARHEELGELPVELYLEGSDQHRGWFQSALLTSVMLRDAAPYKTVLTHGFVLDPSGRKMSKSLGNVVDPNQVIGQLGADVLRLWTASVDYTSDVRIGPEMLQQLAEVYRKIRNTIRFLLGNLAGFDPARDAVAVKELGHLDRYTLHRLQEVVQTLTEAFEAYEFHHFYQVLQNFCVVELSSLYFDAVKDILYCNASTDPTRRGVQTVLYELLTTLLPMLVPVMPHLAEDIWQHWPAEQKPANAPESAVLLPWPDIKKAFVDAELSQAFEPLLALKTAVNTALEVPRAEGKIGSSLEARVVIVLGNQEMTLPELTQSELETFCLTSQAEFSTHYEAPEKTTTWHSSAQEGGIFVHATPALGAKCERCWKYQEDVGAHSDHPTLCGRCHTAVSSVPREALS